MSWLIEIRGHAGGDDAEASAVRQVFVDAIRACRQLNLGLDHGSWTTTTDGGTAAAVIDEDPTTPDLSAVPSSPRKDEEQLAYPDNDATPSLQQGSGD